MLRSSSGASKFPPRRTSRHPMRHIDVASSMHAPRRAHRRHRLGKVHDRPPPRRSRRRRRRRRPDRARRAAAGVAGARRAIAAEFGERMLRADGSLDRAALGAAVFGDPAAVIRLNAIVHPAVRAESARRFAAAFAADPRAVVVYDVPLLVEARVDDPWELIVVAHAPAEVRLQAARGAARHERSGCRGPHRLAGARRGAPGHRRRRSSTRPARSPTPSARSTSCGKGWASASPLARLAEALPRVCSVLPLAGARGRTLRPRTAEVRPWLFSESPTKSPVRRPQRRGADRALRLPAQHAARSR